MTKTPLIIAAVAALGFALPALASSGGSPASHPNTLSSSAGIVLAQSATSDEDQKGPDQAAPEQKSDDDNSQK
jgi:hypothetical protein